MQLESELAAPGRPLRRRRGPDRLQQERRAGALRRRGGQARGGSESRRAGAQQHDANAAAERRPGSARRPGPEAAPARAWPGDGLEGELRLFAAPANWPSTACRRRHLRRLRPEARDRPRQSGLQRPGREPAPGHRATRPNLDVRVGVQITDGHAGLRVRLFSEPEMSRSTSSWLVLGRASDGLGAPTPRCCSAPRWPCWPATAGADRATAADHRAGRTLGAAERGRGARDGGVARQAALAALVRGLSAASTPPPAPGS